MLPLEIKQKLKQHVAKMHKPVTIVLSSGDHPNRPDLERVLQEVVDASDKMTLITREDAKLRSPISFLLESEGVDTGIRFSGIPYGLEFQSLILAIVQSGGAPIKLDAPIVKAVVDIQTPLYFEVIIRLGCLYCPKNVQKLNQFALLNSHITCEMIDGDLFPALLEDRDIEGFPSIYLNGKFFKEGVITPSEVLYKLGSYL
jgi:NADH-dependent peroxiredoxin subunit F